MVKKPVLIIGGPTASGKSGLALALASPLSGVVINGDSMQIYQGLPILTAQPPAEDCAKIPHKLYAALPPEDTCSAARWRERALDEINKAQAENKLPIIVGGTGFYLKTLLKGISPIPDIPHGLRDKISALQKELGNPAFHQELAKRDPVMAVRLPPFNTQRLVRAWEVLEATGKSLAEWQALPPVPPPEDLRFLTITLLPPRDKLYAACNARFGQMLQAGALEEVKQFREHCPANAALSKALGYPELSAYLDGKISLEEATIAAQQSTRHYAKRQVTWFRHQIAADLTVDAPAPEKVLAWMEEQRI
ncbi:MAG: tRNA (adenosine(37)-N6)-dimethylallyltransferase MiaA [Alphaproteobacteria bacterium]|nr:tRNA (adenosine(37)-N6)-dimethylallyltransferase MiaA [Alphaproteobacteria bacterium]